MSLNRRIILFYSYCHFTGTDFRFLSSGCFVKILTFVEMVFRAYEWFLTCRGNFA